MLKKYQIYLPTFPACIDGEWDQCRKQIISTSSEGNRPLKLNIFVDVPDYQSYLKLKEIIGNSIKDSFGDQCPAFSVTVHPPEKPWKVTVEALFLEDSSSEITTKYLNSVPYVVIESKSHKEVWGAGLGSGFCREDTRKAANEAFNQVVSILAMENLSLDNVVRQWNYIGNILDIKDGFQNYQVFNEVRSEYYKNFRTVKGYPAATGVGMKLGGVILDFYAVKAGESIKIKPVDNPNQVNAYEYGQQVLKGLAGKNKSHKNPPQFERALLLENKTRSTLYISGTASIIGQETIGKEDVSEQTVVTIENIRKLADSERIGQLMESSSHVYGKYSLIRVYVKKQEDFGIVKAICSEHFPKVPAGFIESDICRDDLLTEIEAEFIL